jgi:hypothetical protein
VVSQTGILSGATSSQAAASQAAALSQVAILAGAPCTQQGLSGTGVLTIQDLVLVGDGSIQLAASSSGMITRILDLFGADVVQVSLSPSVTMEAPELHMPPPDRYFRFKPAAQDGNDFASW